MPPDAQRKRAADLFTAAQSLLAIPERRPDQDEEMVHAAHASAYYWLRAGDARDHMRANWLCARVYAALGLAPQAEWHARLCLRLCSDRALTTFDHARAFEVHARAYAAAKRSLEARITLERARLVAAMITDPAERALMDADIAETDLTLAR
jgi:hypothetical protein